MQAHSISPALERALIRFNNTVQAAGRRHGLSESEIDEVIQEVRIRLWKSVKEGEKIEGLPASYIYKTALSAAVDLLRRNRAKREEPLELVEDRPASVNAASPGHDLEQSELGEQIADAVETLSDARRPVVRMYLAGYERQEIADLLGWTEAKTRNLLYRGLADLRETLTTRGVHPETI
jgi:RNA polymerase sigma-70 factor (ECF subfamily)